MPVFKLWCVWEATNSDAELQIAEEAISKLVTVLAVDTRVEAVYLTLGPKQGWSGDVTKTIYRNKIDSVFG